LHFMSPQTSSVGTSANAVEVSAQVRPVIAGSVPRDLTRTVRPI